MRVTGLDGSVKGIDGPNMGVNISEYRHDLDV